MESSAQYERKWWKEAVVYQIYPRSFLDSSGDGIGDLNGITERLDYLKTLGVDVLWLSPVYRSPNADNGYDISDYEAIMDEFGTMDDFDRLLSEAHRRGLRLIMDLVVNHTSDKHPWFIESRSSVDSPKRDWYFWRSGVGGGEPNGLRSFFSGPAWKADPATGQYYLHLFTQGQPDLNWDCPELRGAVFSMMRRWFDRGIDGFRMDAISMISKPAGFADADGAAHDTAEACSGPRIHQYLKEMNARVLSRYDSVTVGETGGVTVEEAKKYAGYAESELNMVFQFEAADMQHDPVLGKWRYRPFSLPMFKRIMSAWICGLEGAAWNSVFFDNHDQPRALSRYCEYKDDRQRVLAAKMLATLLLTLKGTPFIYQGDELGMANFPFSSLEQCRDVEILNAHRELVLEKGLMSEEEFMSGVRAAGRDNARTPMQWTGGDNAGFTSGTAWLAVNADHERFNAHDELADGDSVFHYYASLIRLRRANPALVYGDYTLLLPEEPQIYAFTRELSGVRAAVLCSFSPGPLPVPDIVPEGAELLISNEAHPAERVLDAFGARVYITTA